MVARHAGERSDRCRCSCISGSALWQRPYAAHGVVEAASPPSCGNLTAARRWRENDRYRRSCGRIDYLNGFMKALWWECPPEANGEENGTRDSGRLLATRPIGGRPGSASGARMIECALYDFVARRELTVATESALAGKKVAAGDHQPPLFCRRSNRVPRAGPILCRSRL